MEYVPCFLGIHTLRETETNKGIIKYRCVECTESKPGALERLGWLAWRSPEEVTFKRRWG